MVRSTITQSPVPRFPGKEVQAAGVGVPASRALLERLYDCRTLVGELCRTHEPQLLVYLTRMLGRVDVAREVIQDTYERIHKLYRPEDVMFPRAMLFKIATNFALMRLRRARLESTLIT